MIAASGDCEICLIILIWPLGGYATTNRSFTGTPSPSPSPSASTISQSVKPCCQAGETRYKTHILSVEIHHLSIRSPSRRQLLRRPLWLIKIAKTYKNPNCSRPSSHFRRRKSPISHVSIKRHLIIKLQHSISDIRKENPSVSLCIP